MDSPGLPTERTPLINGTNIRRSIETRTLCLVEFECALYGEELQRNDRSNLSIEAIKDHVNSCYSLSRTTESALVIILCLRRISVLHADVLEAIQEPASLVAQYENYAFEELARLLNPGMDEELDAILWSSFLIDMSGSKRQSVMRALFELPFVNKSWLSLALSSQVLRSVMRAWKRGVPVCTDDVLESTQQVTKLPQLRRIATPRVLHLSELIFFVGYMIVFAHYLLDPPYRNIFNPSPPPEWRTILLIVYAVSNIARVTWRRAFPSYLTVLSFLSALPSTPGPTDGSYSMLIVAFSIHFIQLHLPLPPSLVFLTPLSSSMPLSVILISFVEHVLAPVLSFFLPAFIITTFLLSISLSDVFLLINTATYVDPAPVNARVGFLFLLSLVGLLFLCLLASVLFISPSFEGDKSTSDWNAYGSKIGLQTRRHFLNAVETYSDLFLFPAPFNLLHVLLIRIPSKVLRLLKRPTLASGTERFAQVVLWSIIVLPIAFATGVVWVWGLA